ncbi:hypothetical protein [Algibacter pectinivorans]|uniref:Dolichyl-phosphate-mannose-protein mannosyltransferase n=1 Tax=Algibacter pectinivorans TaxID=870482 RepID=A0A1I1P9W4_9FLAO|nr:hypothetical protein [Algibacter pectinivorans]SFD02780.1 hypothetical protein SAMN04487987_10335 [Algibacter pectinivorans]
METKQIIIHKRFFIAIIIISVLSALRSLLIPVHADELTYSKLADNILLGQYYLVNNPSSIAPTIPFVFALFKIKTFPVLGIILNKIFNLCLVGFGFRFIALYLKQQNVSPIFIGGILALTAVNPNAVAWFSTLYPESLIFFGFWGFIYYVSRPPKQSYLIKILAFFILMVFTRYLYAVLGVVILLCYYDYLKENFKNYSLPIVTYSLIFLIPVILWAKYLLNIEEQNLSEISYFNRFKVGNPLLYNIKCGLGLEQHHEVDKINGIPAFASLFIPITGFRNYLISFILIFGFVCGLVKHLKRPAVSKLFISSMLIMLGFVFAGTGFSRYWLVLLPSFYLGYYYLFKLLNIRDKWIVYGSQLVSFIYILNEIRLDILIVNKYL